MSVADNVPCICGPSERLKVPNFVPTPSVANLLTGGLLTKEIVHPALGVE